MQVVSLLYTIPVILRSLGGNDIAQWLVKCRQWLLEHFDDVDVLSKLGQRLEAFLAPTILTATSYDQELALRIAYSCDSVLSSTMCEWLSRVAKTVNTDFKAAPHEPLVRAGKLLRARLVMPVLSYSLIMNVSSRERSCHFLY